jgi:hypothetical protein
MSLDNAKFSLRPDASLTRNRRWRLERHESEKATLQPTGSLSRVGLEEGRNDLQRKHGLE